MDVQFSFLKNNKLFQEMKDFILKLFNYQIIKSRLSVLNNNKN